MYNDNNLRLYTINILSARIDVRSNYSIRWKTKFIRHLCKCDEYKITTLFSSQHSKTNSVDDSRGYDLKYRKKGEVMSSCLGIKYYYVKSNILTDNQYVISQSAECTGRYDLVLAAYSGR